jgi:hypothetical protein
MNDSKVRRVLFWNSSCVFSFYIALRWSFLMIFYMEFLKKNLE